MDQVGLVGCEARDAALRHQGELLQDVALTNLGQSDSARVQWFQLTSEQYSLWFILLPNDFLRKNMESLSSPI